MSKADETWYIYEDNDCIFFASLNNKSATNSDVIIYKKDKYIKFNKQLLEYLELQAINEKVKELGWNE